MGGFFLDAFLVCATAYCIYLMTLPSRSYEVLFFLAIVFSGLFIVRRGWILKWNYRVRSVKYEPSGGRMKPDTIRTQAEANLQRPLGEAAPQRLEASRLPIYTISLNTIERFRQNRRPPS